MRRQLAETFRSLRVRNYRLFAIGQLTSLLGRWMQIVAIDWLVLELSGNSGAALGFVTALQFVPVLLLSLHGGKLADRHDKRRMLLVFNTSWLALSAGMAVIVLIGAAQLWHIYVFALMLGMVMALENPARQSFVSEMVGTGMLPNALSLSAATFNSARIVGPAIAGALIAVVDTGPVLAITALTYVPPMVCLLLMNRHELGFSEPAKDTRIREAVSYTFRRSDLVLPLVLMFVVGGLGFNFPITLALLSKTVFHTGAATFGLLTTMLAVGALAGALVSSRRRARPTAHIVLAAAAIFGVLEALVGFAPAFWVAAVLLVPTGFSMTFLAQAVNQRIQLGVDAAHRGRVMALYILVFLGSTPIFAPIIGWLSEVIGPRSGLWIGGLAGVFMAATAFAVRCRKRDVHVSVELRPRPRMRLIETVEKAA
ncbi:MFS transporter [Stackebrandtia nassauensis]|uniref:Major facilitator superfamily MFS_1 n=1 Tax=Stackebrandtia nassauensis (strain DSM 44728 / CIP 108903 / NRRL B-16338 / NBRC 102104 / LLR-40K-21) TaxID=446470 RepID=D3PZ51_STANL|nr:MFS transporter [Stackebrandtia nassauensis]ADD45480.1 major facilitator superfamily MFS_1 [Stackebrandtia nassauensis DSM 44728]